MVSGEMITEVFTGYKNSSALKDQDSLSFVIIHEYFKLFSSV